jgi:hypothetical protein
VWGSLNRESTSRRESTEAAFCLARSAPRPFVKSIGKWAALLLAAAAGLVTARAQYSVALAWNPSTTSGVTGYRVYSGAASHAYTNVLQVGNATNATVSGLAPGTTYYFAVTAVNSLGLESVTSTEINYSVPAANTAPVISSIPSQTTLQNTATPAIGFTVSDSQTSASNLVVTAASSNPTLVPANNLQLGGSGSNRTIKITPAANQIGTATVTLTVSDGSLAASTSFLLLVVSPPPSVTLSSPSDGSAYSAPADIAISATLTANGHTINAVRFYSGTNLLAQISNAPYSFTWTNVPAASYSLCAQAVYDGSSTITSSPASISVLGLPPPWQTCDIGRCSLTGTAAVSNGTYILQGSGTISGSADAFRFLYQDLTGDGEISSQINALTNTSGSGCVGVMIRESLTSSSRYILMAVAQNGGYRFLRRSTTAGGTSTTKSGTGVFPNQWVRLVRSGNVLTGYKSSDGKTWSQVGSCTIAMASNIYVGLATCSGNTTKLSTGKLANVVVIP